MCCLCTRIKTVYSPLCLTFAVAVAAAAAAAAAVVVVVESCCILKLAKTSPIFIRNIPVFYVP